MSFQIHALPMTDFAELFDLTDAELAARNALRVTADASPGFPCRVSLVDADPGEDLILLNYAHLTGATPYAASHAIYVRKGAVQAKPPAGMVPAVLSERLLSVRALDGRLHMQEAEVIEGNALAACLDSMFKIPTVEIIHIHNAKPGCYAACATRA